MLRRIRRVVCTFLGIKKNTKSTISPEEYYKSLGVQIGEHVSLIEPINFGSEPYLITIGDYTTISFDVALVTHDGATRVIRNLPKNGNKETGLYGEIVIGKNCFIGCRTTILPNVHIGDNTIVGAGSLVLSDLPANVVAAGNPCKVICSLEEYRNKNKSNFFYIQSLSLEEKKKYLMSYFNREIKESEVFNKYTR